MVGARHDINAFNITINNHSDNNSNIQTTFKWSEPNTGTYEQKAKKNDKLTRDIFKVSDPYNSIELTCCSLIFGKQEVDENRNMKQKKKD